MVDRRSGTFVSSPATLSCDMDHELTRWEKVVPRLKNAFIGFNRGTRFFASRDMFWHRGT